MQLGFEDVREASFMLKALLASQALLL